MQYDLKQIFFKVAYWTTVDDDVSGLQIDPEFCLAILEAVKHFGRRNIFKNNVMMHYDALQSRIF